jgi:hypothetical protein
MRSTKTVSNVVIDGIPLRFLQQHSANVYVHIVNSLEIAVIHLFYCVVLFALFRRTLSVVAHNRNWKKKHKLQLSVTQAFWDLEIKVGEVGYR